MRLRATDFIAYGWTACGLMVAFYAITKSNTSSAEIVVLPSYWSRWLDSNYDVRTLIMALLVGAGPTFLFASSNNRVKRRIVLATVCFTLVGLEVAQIWIPTRRFGMPDVLYSIAGCAILELVATIYAFLIDD